MKQLLFLSAFLFGILTIKGQKNDEMKIKSLQEKIVLQIRELNKVTSINYVKHTNQIEGFKDGLWIESTNGMVWFVNYRMGFKDGQLTGFYASGQKNIEATYKYGYLIDKVIIYDLKGVVERSYENITLNDSIVDVQEEKVENGKIVFSMEKHKYEYKAYMKRYTEEGFLYTEGYGLFDDNKIFYTFKIGKWMDHTLRD